MQLKHFNNHVINVSETGSTNSRIQEENNNGKLLNGSALITEKQTVGKGQRGNIWVSEPHKNLTFSVITFPNIDSKFAFHLNIIAALAVQKTLKDLKLIAKIKWPNDILINSKKICGILVENQIASKNIVQSVIGIGLNVNQIDFEKSLNATSLKLEGVSVELKDVFNQIYSYLDFYYNLLIESNFKLLLKLYYDNMLWYNSIGNFDDGNSTFKAILKGINNQGLLHLIKEGGKNSFYDIKEIKFLYQ